MRTIITPKDFRDINRHLERIEKTDYDRDDEEETEYEDDGSDAYDRLQERDMEENQPSYMQSPYYDGT